MRRVSRVGVINISLCLFALALLGRAAWVQLWEGQAWAARAVRQHFTDAPVPAPRGDILDATEQPLAESREMLRLAVAPRDVRQPGALRRALTNAGVPPQFVIRSTDTRRSWVVLPGRYLPSDVASAIALRGVSAEPASERVYAMPLGLRGLVGQVGAEGNPIEGMELALDSLLRGVGGSATLLRDVNGRRFESPTDPGIAPRKGHDVVLTVNHELQGICERALADAAARLGASGGDIVVLDPHDGSILAVASRRGDLRVVGMTALTEPFEPGSTIKPLVAAALLSRGRATPSDTVDVFGGTWTDDGRTITDVHKLQRPTLQEVIRWSSNIGISRFVQRLSPREEFESLRDFGFGTQTGVPYPSEASGTLRPPREWSRFSQASLAMGYEISVTPLQLALAYAAIANGGELLEPSLIREIRDPDGNVRYRHTRRVVRRIVSEDVARQVRTMLGEAVEHGTGLQADLSSFAVAGKTGTARQASRGSYAQGKYYASFVGLFPADAPQYVILVKLDDPARYYGGVTAAPVTKAVLEAALAARDAALDRSALASKSMRRSRVSTGDTVRVARQATDAPSVPVVVALDSPVTGAPAGGRSVAVPNVSGMPLREAVAALHRVGVQVQLGRGAPGTTLPVAGARVARGSTVRLMHDED